MCFVCWNTNTNLEFPEVIDQQVLRFEVPVQDSSLVAVSKSSQQLEQEDLPTHTGIHINIIL